MRRDLPTTTSPEIEESRTELEHLEGAKRSSQSEILAIAENKKQIEEERRATITRLDDEIVQKRAETAGALSAHREAVVYIAQAREKADGDFNKANAEKVRAEQDRDRVFAEVSNLKDSQITLTRSLNKAVEEEKTTKDLIVSLKKQETVLREIMADLGSRHKSERAALNVTLDNHAKARASFEVEKNEHENLSSTKSSKQKELEELNTSLDQKKAELAKVETAIGELHQKRAEHDLHIAEQDKKSNDRLAAATRLEEHVDAKLTHLKELEKGFTVEHLARVGYKPIGT